MAKLTKLQRSNKAHERLFKDYNKKINVLILDKKNYSKEKHLEYAVKRFYHKSVLDYQLDHKKVASLDDRKRYFDYAVRNVK